MQSLKKSGPLKRQRSTSRSPSPSPTWPDSSRKKKAIDDSVTRTQRNIPAFLNKLYSMVDDPSTNELIRWSKEGNSFIVEQHELFSKTVLPRFYKHNTFSSFVRQLNMYDFHKVPHLQQGVLLVDNEHELWEFTHPNFQRNRHELLHLVTRKRIRNNNNDQQPLQPSPQTSQQQQLLLGQQFATTETSPTRSNPLGDTSMQLEYVRLGSLVKDISTIRQHQHAISTDLQHLHNDNEILWRETLLAREKHQRHQQVIERILLFLTSVFSGNDAKSGDAARQSHYMLSKQNEAGPPQTGHLDSIAGPPGRLIEEAVKLAGISTTALQEKFASQDVSPTPTMAQQPTQPAALQANHQEQGQEKGKLGMYGKGATDPSPLTLLLNDLYSLRDTFTSNLHGMNASSAMQPSSSRSEKTMLPTGYPPQLQYQQPHLPANHMTVFRPNDDYDNYTNKQTDINPLLAFPNLHPNARLPGLVDGNDTGDVTRIAGLAESLHTATRSAEAISQDIDDLQISIESLAATMGLDTNGTDGFDGYIDEFTDNYSNMISLATKNDKMQLFQLADDDRHRQTTNID